MSESLLIYILSSKGKVNIDQYNKIFSMTCLASESEDDDLDSYTLNQISRLLEALGFCEFDFDKRILYMCQPFLVLLPTFGLPNAVLVGARTPNLIKNLKIAVSKRRETAQLIEIEQARQNKNIPALVKIEAIDTKTISEIANECNIKHDLDQPVAWSLVNLSSSILELQQSLKFEKMPELNWSGKRIFSIKKLSFSDHDDNNSTNLFKLLEYKNPVNQQKHYWLWNGDQAAQVTLDWGRYLLLKYNNANVLLYDEKLSKMAVPFFVPLPNILAKSAALCSGLAPIQGKVDSNTIEKVQVNNLINIYSDIPKPIVDKIAEKLGQELILISLKNNIAKCKQ